MRPIILVLLSLLIIACSTTENSKEAVPEVKKEAPKATEPEDGLSAEELAKFAESRKNIEEILMTTEPRAAIAFVHDNTGKFFDIASNVEAVQTALEGLSQRDRMVLARKLNDETAKLHESGGKVTLEGLVERIQEEAGKIKKSKGEEF